MSKSNSLVQRAIDSGDYTIDEVGNIYRRGKLVPPQFHKGYGRYRLRVYGTKIYVHRIIGYVKFGNEIFCSGVEVHHIDLNPLNNSPANLELVPRGTHLAQYHSGENNASHKLTWGKVNRMRAMWETGMYTYASLSRIFGIADVNVKKIILGQRWKESDLDNKSER